MDIENKMERLRAQQATGQLGPIKWTYQKVHGPDKPLDDGAVLAQLEAFLVKHPMRAPTRMQAGIHEAAHFVAFERLGLVAGTAAIYGSAFGRAGWGGEASAWNSLYHIPTLPQDWSPDALLREAQAGLAGPLAEELLGDGDVLGSIGELVEAAVFAERAGQLTNRDESEARRDALLGAVSLVERHAPEVLDIAALLERRGRISRSQPSIRKILARVKQAAVATGSVSERGVALARKIEDAVKELAL